MPPLPPTPATPSHTLADCTFLGPGMTPKHVKKTLKKQRAPMEAQRVKTRGPNPNPTAQAQSKRCLPLSTKTQNIIEDAILRASIFSDFVVSFRKFFTKSVQRGSGHAPKRQKVIKMDVQCCTNDTQGCQTGAPRSPKVPKGHHHVLQIAKVSARVPQWSCKVMHNAKKTPRGHPKKYFFHWGKTPGC